MSKQSEIFHTKSNSQLTAELKRRILGGKRTYPIPGYVASPILRELTHQALDKKQALPRRALSIPAKLSKLDRRLIFLASCNATSKVTRHVVNRSQSVAIFPASNDLQHFNRRMRTGHFASVSL